MELKRGIVVFCVILSFLVMYVEYKTSFGDQAKILKYVEDLENRILDQENSYNKWKTQVNKQLIGLNKEIRVLKYKTQNSNNINNNNETEIEKDKIEKYRLAVGILTRPASKDRRDTIRDTWVHLLDDSPKKNFTYKFVVGKVENETLYAETLEESIIHGDILFVDEMDTYYNLSYKSMEIFRWASEDIYSDYLLKTDDDTFVRVDRMIDDLKNHPKEKFYGGKSLGNYAPRRDPNDMYYVSYEDYPIDIGTPVLISGSGYLLSHDCVAFLGKKSHENIKYIRLEDVNTMNILDEMGGVYGEELPGFLYVGGCENDMFMSHYRSNADMKQYFDNIKATGDPCGKSRSIEVTHNHSMCSFSYTPNP